MKQPIMMNKVEIMKIIGVILLVAGIVFIFIGIGAPMFRVATHESMHLNFMISSAIGIVVGILVMLTGISLLKKSTKNIH